MPWALFSNSRLISSIDQFGLSAFGISKRSSNFAFCLIFILSCSLKINGSAYIGTNIDFRSNPARECKVNANFIIALNAGDYLEIFGNNYVVSGQAYFGGGNSNAERNKSHLYGYRLIT